VAVDGDTVSEPLTEEGQPVESAESVAATREGRAVALRIALFALLVVLALLIGLGVWMGRDVLQERRADEHRQMVVGVARQAALNLTTIDHVSVDSDVRRIIESSTGPFHDDFESRSDVFVQAVIQAQSKSEGSVTEAGLESQDGEDSQVLVSVAVKTSIAGVQEPQPRAWRMRVTVTESGDQSAKVSNVQFVP
jgi:Mce-associated membrane protein